MARHLEWERTFVPGTRILANREGITDPEFLRSREYTLSASRQAEIEAGDVDLPETFDAEHLQAIQRHLFSDLYEWAGRVRTYPLWKNPAVPFADPSDIGRYLEHACRPITDTDWRSLEHAATAHAAASVFAYVNHAHPFREGNGRASKVFMTQLVLQYGWDLDFGRVSPAEWNQASALSPPDRGSFHPVPDFLVPVFARILVSDR